LSSPIIFFIQEAEIHAVLFRISFKREVMPEQTTINQ
jgi:hypothetical protein